MVALGRNCQDAVAGLDWRQTALRPHQPAPRNLSFLATYPRPYPGWFLEALAKLASLAKPRRPGDRLAGPDEILTQHGA